MPGRRYSAPPKPDLARKTSSRGSPNLVSSRQQAWSETTQSKLPASRCSHSASTSSRERSGGLTLPPRPCAVWKSASRWPTVTSRRKSMCGNVVCHQHRRLDRLARGEVQQVDVGQLGLVREVGRDGDREALGVRRPGGAVGLEPGQVALLLDQPGVGAHDLGGLAVQRQRDLVGRSGNALSRAAWMPRITNSKCARS